MPSLFIALALTLPLTLGAPEDARAIVNANNQFAFDLYARLGKSHDNVFFSPYSIEKALAMAYAGARGETATEMATVLRLPAGAKVHRDFAEMRRQMNAGLHGVHINQAASLWGQQGFGFERAFLKLLDECYGAGLREVDFKDGDAARRTINHWVEQETSGKIRNLFGPGALDDTRLALVTAISFKGDWLHGFQNRATRPEPFHVRRDRTVQVSMMNQTETIGYEGFSEAQVLEMPYVGKDLSLVVLLPRDSDGLADLEKVLTAEKLAYWTARLRECEVQVSLPPFKMESDFELTEVLAAMGMRSAFTPAADFRGMTTKEPLRISTVVHKAYVEVNERGTEAAAASGVAVALAAAPIGGGPPPIPVFRADHPFVFAIRDRRTGVLLFVGRYVEP
jgi:serpin B